MIKNIIFDFGRVLVDYQFRKRVDSWGMSASEMADFETSILSMEWVLKIDKGEKPFGAYIDELKGLYPHIAPYFQRFHDEFELFITGQIPGMYELLQELKENGYKLYGLTNWSDSIYPILKKYPIFQLLDGMLISSEEKLIKPDVAIYNRLFEKFNLKPEECIFIDDNSKNVEGSEKAGMKAILFLGAEDCRQKINSAMIRG